MTYNVVHTLHSWLRFGSRQYDASIVPVGWMEGKIKYVANAFRSRGIKFFAKLLEARDSVRLQAYNTIEDNTCELCKEKGIDCMVTIPLWWYIIDNYTSKLSEMMI